VTGILKNTVRYPTHPLQECYDPIKRNSFHQDFKTEGKPKTDSANYQFSGIAGSRLPLGCGLCTATT